MTLKLKEVLKLNHFDKAEILTSIESQMDLQVDSISVIEYPIENFVRDREIVLTTCINCESLKLFTEFVTDVSKLNATALVIAMGCYIENIPESIIEISESNNLVLITIPWEVRFGEILESVYDLLRKEKNLQIERYRVLKDRLISMFLEKDTLDTALNYIESSMKLPCAIIDKDRSVIFQSQGYTHDNLKNKYSIYKIEHNNIYFGSLLLDVSNIDIKKDERKEYDKIVYQNIINPIVLWFERNQAIFEMEIHYKEKFILNIIDQKDVKWEEVVSEGKTYGFNLDKMFISIVAKVDSSTDLINEQELIKNIKDLAIRIAKVEGRECLIAYKNTFLIIFLEYQQDTFEFIKSFINKFEITAKNLNNNLTFIWGIGETYNKGNTLYYSYMDAITSLKNGLKYGSDHINNMTSNMEFKVFAELSNNGVIEDIIGNVLKDLISDDNQDLLETLTEYFINNRNVSKTAEQMFLHRQSLNYRLRKIESLTNLSLDNHRESFLLELCVKMHQFNKIREA